MSSDMHGLMAEFADAHEVVVAAERVHHHGYTKVDAYAPYPHEELAHALHLPKSHVSKIVLLGGLAGMAAGYGLCYVTSVFIYPLNIGGRPLHSWPAFIVPTYETTILFAALSAVVGMLLLNGLPQPYHPAFHVPEFARASTDRFFICIESEDPRFDAHETRRFLEALPGVAKVTEVPR